MRTTGCTIVPLAVLASLFLPPSLVISADATYAGSNVCKSCHSGPYGAWAKTTHATDFSQCDYNGVKTNLYTYANGACASCHVVGYEKPSGYDSKKPWDQQEKLLRVGCENCHGPAGRHIAATGAAKRTTVSKSVAPEECMVCHVSSYGPFPTGPVQDKDIAGTPRRQSAMLMGVNGYEYPGSTYESSPHKDVVQGMCITCHLNPVKPHELQADIETCQKCHSGATSLNVNGRQDEIKSLLANLKTKLDAFRNGHAKTAKDAQGKDVTTWDSSENQLVYNRARYNFDFVSNDRSYGVHNYKYARQLLTESIAKLPI